MTIKPDYTGHIEGDKQSRISIAVKGKPDNRHGKARIQHINLFCDDDQFHRRNLPIVALDFDRSGRSFFGQAYFNSELNQTVLLVEGTLKRHATVAKGTVYWMQNASGSDPTRSADCSIGVPSPFRADRARTR